MTIKFLNTNERYGDEGPFKAESKEELADEMKDQFEVWALEKRNKLENGEAMTDEERDAFDAKVIAGMREEFIDGLVAQYHGEPDDYTVEH